MLLHEFPLSINLLTTIRTTTRPQIQRIIHTPLPSLSISASLCLTLSLFLKTFTQTERLRCHSFTFIRPFVPRIYSFVFTRTEANKKCILSAYDLRKIISLLVFISFFFFPSQWGFWLSNNFILGFKTNFELVYVSMTRPIEQLVQFAIEYTDGDNDNDDDNGIRRLVLRVNVY